MREVAALSQVERQVRAMNAAADDEGVKHEAILTTETQRTQSRNCCEEIERMGIINYTIK
jgi:hypothetical protein